MDRGFLSDLLNLELEAGWPARLDGWRLAFNKGGDGASGIAVVANIVEEAGCSVYGVVYRLPVEALRALDDFERAPEHYRRATVWVEPLGRRARQAALVYIGQPRWLVRPGSPDPGYLEILLGGARQHALPERYSDWVQALATGETAQPFRSSEPHR
jgi:cation transport regulator ChaC